MAFALIAHAAAGCTGGDIIAGPTSGVDTTGANLLIIVASIFGNFDAQLPTDNKGNTYVALTPLDGTGANSVCIFICQSPTVGTGHTATWNTGGSVFPSIYFAAFSGAGSGTIVDQQSNAQAVQPGSITPSEDNELIITGFCTNGGGVTPSITAGGFTVSDAIAFLASGDNEGGGLAYLIQTTAGAANPTWATNPSPRSVIASFKTSTSGPTEIDITKSDSFSFSDSVIVLIPVPNIVGSDSLNLSDQLAIGFGNLYSDTATLSDLMAFGLSLPVSITGDVLSLTDQIIFLIGVGLGETDFLSFSDVLKIGAGTSRILGDNILLSDFLAALVANLPLYSDNFALSDSAQLNLSLGLSQNDSLSLSDAVIITLSNNLLLSESDSLSLSDSLEYNLSSSLDQYIRHYLNDVPR